MINTRDAPKFWMPKIIEKDGTKEKDGQKYEPKIYGVPPHPALFSTQVSLSL